jgi:hypothetical protein
VLPACSITGACLAIRPCTSVLPPWGPRARSGPPAYTTRLAPITSVTAIVR